MRKKRTYTLQFILGLLVLFAVLMTGASSLYTAFQVNKASLAENYLRNNFNYAKKLASNTAEILLSMQNTMGAIALHEARHRLSDTDLTHWLMANKRFFNSIFIVDANGFIRNASPSSIGYVKGKKVTSHAAQEAMLRKKPLISEPYRAITNRLIVLISSPIFDSQGKYQGFVGGSIYLEENNVLSRILKEHFYGDGSYVYVVDKAGTIIFHPDSKRLGETVTINPAINKAIAGHNGYEQLVNSRGIEFFAGYAYEKTSGWGIISQTPTAVIDHSLQKLLNNMLITTFPFLLIIFVIVWLVSRYISNPLYKLAKFSDEAVKKEGERQELPHIRSRIYEVEKLYKSTRLALRRVKQRLTQLQAEVETDGLTRLANRRTFDHILEEWVHDQVAFSLIFLDIDHFKVVNDEYGHVAGDEVIQLVAKTMLEQCREEDLIFRYGGEEFCILIRDKHTQLAYHIAERLRKTIEALDNPTGHAITISLGISTFPSHATSPVEIITYADQALYLSKMEGRNRTTVYHPKEGPF
ncbi:MAG: diguanylate cyclase [Clostridia bacterium]